MITFLPFSDFARSAKSLDKERLGKQRSEVKQLLISIYFQTLKGNVFLAQQVGMDMNLLIGQNYGRLENHPARKMWSDYPFALIAYGLIICLEWRGRGYADNTFERINAFTSLNESIYADQEWLAANHPELLPAWLGDERVHQSHRSNLIRKNPTWYHMIQGWNDPDDIPYYWPSNDYN